MSQHVWELPSDISTIPSFKTYIQAYLPDFIQKNNITSFVVSMELGPSLDFVESVISFQNTYSLALTCIIPFEEQHSTWKEKHRTRYFSVLKHCHEEYMLSRHFSLDCYQRSFQYLAKTCCSILSFHGSTPSEAKTASRYARKLGRSVHVLDPSPFLPIL